MMQGSCAICGAVLEPEGRYCTHCGAVVSGVSAPRPGDATSQGDSRAAAPSAASNEGTNGRSFFRKLFGRRSTQQPVPQPVVQSVTGQRMVGGRSGESAAGDFSGEDDTSVLNTNAGPAVSADDNNTALLGASIDVCFIRQRTGTCTTLAIGPSVSVVLGKGSAATCRVGGNKAISRQHARVHVEGDAVFITDLESTNGTRVNGDKLMPDRPVRLVDGAMVDLADERFEFRMC